MRGLAARIREAQIAGVRRLRQRTLPRVAKWLILAFAFGIVMGGLVFRRGNPVAQPQISSAAESPAPIPPVVQRSQASETPVKPQSSSELPGTGPGIEKARLEPPVIAALPQTSPPPPRANTLTDVAAGRRTARVTKVASRSTAVNLPRFTGSLAIDSHPRGAVVSVDGQVAGTTPLVLRDVAAGSRVVRIHSNGYELWSSAARVVANQETRVTATLQR